MSRRIPAVLSLGLNGTISGRIRVEGGATPSFDFVRLQFKNNVPTSIFESGPVEGTTQSGAQVVLIPLRNRERTELFRSVTADSAGHFTIPNISPGDYTLTAWESIEPFSFFDSNLIRQAEAQGKAIRVEGSSRQVVNVAAMK